MNISHVFFIVGILFFLVVTYASAQFRLDQSLLCNKKWARHASNRLGLYPDYNDASMYAIYYLDGTGDYRDIKNDTLRSKFTWKYRSSSNSIDIVNDAPGKTSHYKITIVFLTSDLMVIDSHYESTRPGTIQEPEVRLYYKRVEDVIRSEAAFDSIKRTSKGRGAFRLLQIPETPDKVKIGAYFPRRYSVTNYQIVGNKIFFSTLGAGLLVYDKKDKTWSRRDVSNTPGLPLAIGSLKYDKEGGLWLVSYSLTHWKPDGLMHYYVVYNDKAMGIEGSIIGHDTHENLLFCDDKGASYTLNIGDLAGLATGVLPSKDSSGYRYASKFAVKTLADCNQLLQLWAGVATVRNDSLFYVRPSTSCNSNEYRIMYEERNDIMQWGGCQCEFKRKHWTVSEMLTKNGNDKYRPYEISAPFPKRSDGQINYDANLKIGGFPMKYEGNRFFSLFGSKLKIDITERLGVWEYDSETRRHNLAVKYKFASPEEILSDTVRESNVWLMINHEDAEKSFDIFEKRQEAYPSKKWFYANTSTTTLQMKGDTISIQTGDKTHHVPIQIQKLSAQDRFDNFAIEFRFPFIWISTNDYLYKFELDKRFKIVRKYQYHLGLSQVYGLKHVNKKLLIFTSFGLAVVNLTALN